MARDLAWSFPYVVERNAEDHPIGRTLLRPLVEARIIGSASSNRVAALIDSGSDYTLAAPILAMEAGIDTREGTRTTLRIGGAVREISLVDATVRLCDPTLKDVDGGCEQENALEWLAEVGFFEKWDDPPFSLILGQIGFFDRFTVVMSRFAQGLVLEPLELFDERYGPL